MDEIAQVRSAAWEALGPHLAPVRLVDLEVSEERDAEGEAILRLRVVYDEATGKPTGRQTYEAQGAMADYLEDLGERRFPVLTFISLSDRRQEAA